MHGERFRVNVCSGITSSLINPLSVLLCLSLSVSVSLSLILSLSAVLSLPLYASPSPYIYLPLSVSLSLSLSPHSVVFLQKGLDLFSVLDVMGNSSFLEKLKFVPSEDQLHYYLYNWACPTLHPDKVRLLHQLRIPL